MNAIKNIISNLKRKFLLSTVYQKGFLFLSLLTLVGITVFTFTSADWYFNSDTATANLLAEAIVREGTLFPKSWTYGQEPWVFFLHLPIALLTLFFDNYLMMHSISAMVFIVMAVLVCIYFSRKVLRSNAWVIAIPLLFCGMSSEYLYMVFSQCAYLPQMIYMFLALALFADAMDDDFKLRSKIKFSLLLLLIIFLGLSGLRNVQSVGLPLIGAIALVYFAGHHDEELKDNIKPIIRTVLVLLSLLAAIVIGYKLFGKLMEGLTYDEGIIELISFTDLSAFLSKLVELITAFFIVFGVAPGAELLSMSGVRSLAAVLAFVLIGIVFPILQYKKYGEENFGTKVFLMFSAVHTAEITVIYLFTTLYTTTRYVLTIQMLMMFISANYIYKYVLPKMFKIRTIAVVLLLAMFTVPPTLTHFKNSLRHEQVMAQETALVDYLEENGLEYGYATFWNAYKNTVYSDGKVEINGILLQDYVRPYYWLNDSKRYSEDVHSGQTFILLSKGELEAYQSTFSYTLLGTPVNTLEYGDYIIYVFDYNVAVNNFEGKTNN